MAGIEEEMREVEDIYCTRKFVRSSGSGCMFSSIRIQNELKNIVFLHTDPRLGKHSYSNELKLKPALARVSLSVLDYQV